MVLSRFFFEATLPLFSSLVTVSAIDYSQGSQPDTGNSIPVEKEKPLPTGVEGHIFYVIRHFIWTDSRITCLAVDEYGYETAPFSFSSDATDANGYFSTTLSPSEINEKLQLSQCKAFLENSPLETCKFPTEVNKEVRGAVLNSYRVLSRRELKLYWAGPFFSITEPKSLPNGYW